MPSNAPAAMATISDSVRCGRMLKHPTCVEDY